MSLTTVINANTIPDSDILEYPKSIDTLAFEENKVSPGEISIIIDNTDKTVYDDRYAGSLFYGANFFGQDISVYDSVVNRYIFDGILKDLQVNDSDNRLTVVATSELDKLSDITCIYSNATNKTIAQIIYEILTDSSNGGIPTTKFVYRGFQKAINIQTSNSAYINIDYDAENKKTCMNVINELLRISQCHIYTYQNLIYMYQWEEYAGEIGEALYNRNVIIDSYKQYYNQKTLYNYYRVCYDNAGTIAYSEGSDAGSIAQFEERRFNVPDKDVDDTATSKFRISFRNSTGAAWAGALAVSRYKNLQKIAEIQLGYEMDYVKLADQINMRYDPFIGEPVQLIEREPDKENNKINAKILFLNTPEEYYDRDSEPPASPELYAAIPLSDGGVFLKWTMSTETDWAGYRVYFTSSKGEWFIEECNYGISPVEVKNNNLTQDGFIYLILYQLNSGTEYSFYVTSYDDSYNESDPSNIFSARPVSPDVDKYMCTGDEANEVTLDELNTFGGSAPSGFDVYGTGVYGTARYEPCACFTSAQFCDTSGFTSFTWKAIGDMGVQYRTSTDGSTWIAWSAEIDAVAINGLSLSTDYFQYRFLFNANSWSATDYFFIKGLE